MPKPAFAAQASVPALAPVQRELQLRAWFVRRVPRPPAVPREHEAQALGEGVVEEVGRILDVSGHLGQVLDEDLRADVVPEPRGGEVRDREDEPEPVSREVPEQLDVVPASVVDVDALVAVDRADQPEDAPEFVVLASAVGGDRRLSPP